jgi:hypothetical protein
MEDLPAFQAKTENEANRLMGMGIMPEETFTLLLDNEAPVDGADEPFGVAAADLPLPERVECDELEVGAGTWWSRLDDQPNIGQPLKDALHQAYGAP